MSSIFSPCLSSCRRCRCGELVGCGRHESSWRSSSLVVVVGWKHTMDGSQLLRHRENHTSPFFLSSALSRNCRLVIAIHIAVTIANRESDGGSGESSSWLRTVTVASVGQRAPSALSFCNGRHSPTRASFRSQARALSRSPAAPSWWWRSFGLADQDLQSSKVGGFLISIIIWVIFFWNYFH